MTTGIRRGLALALVVGGLVGVAMLLGVVFGDRPTLAGTPVLWLWVVGWVALFAWAAFAGVRLWQGAAYGLRWAPLLFACQVPVVALPWVKYQWFTGANIAVVIDVASPSTPLRMAFEVGANGQFFLRLGSGDIAIGANLFALAAVLLLLRAGRRRGARPAGPAQRVA